MKALIKYPGSKWRLAPWIISHFPEHHSYLEPFFGSGAVLFNKQRSHIETVNDLDGEVVNFFECIRKDPERLARDVYLTPYSRESYEKAYDIARKDSNGSGADGSSDDPFDRALAFCIRLNQGYGFRTTGEKVGWKNDVQGRERAYAARGWCMMLDRIMQAAERLREVQIECRPAVELIKRFNYPNVLIYADPPYMLETRNGKQYRCEMFGKDHEELLDALLAHKGPVLVSGYDSPLYDDALRGWRREETVSHTQSGSRKTEVLWLNFEPVCQLKFFGNSDDTFGKYGLTSRSL